MLSSIVILSQLFNSAENQPVIPSPVSTYTPSVTETRGGVEPAGEDTVQHFPYLQDNSDKVLETSPSETSLHTAPGMRICSGMKQEITAVCVPDSLLFMM